MVIREAAENSISIAVDVQYPTQWRKEHLFPILKVGFVRMEGRFVVIIT
jgi:hypothetical protein